MKLSLKALTLSLCYLLAGCNSLQGIVSSFGSQKIIAPELSTLPNNPGNIIVKNSRGQKTYPDLKSAVSSLRNGDEIILPEGHFLASFPKLTKVTNITVTGKGPSTVLTGPFYTNEVTFRDLDIKVNKYDKRRYEVANGTRSQSVVAFNIADGRVWLENVNLRGRGNLFVKTNSTYSPKESALIWILGKNDITAMNTSSSTYMHYGSAVATRLFVNIHFEPSWGTDGAKDYCSKESISKRLDENRTNLFCNSVKNQTIPSEGKRNEILAWINSDQAIDYLMTPKVSYDKVHNERFERILAKRFRSVINRIYKAEETTSPKSLPSTPSKSYQSEIILAQKLYDQGLYLSAAYLLVQPADNGNSNAKSLLLKTRSKIAANYSLKVVGNGSKYVDMKKQTLRFTQKVTDYMSKHYPLTRIAANNSNVKYKANIMFDVEQKGRFSKSRTEVISYVRETVESANRRRASQNAARKARMDASFAEASASISAAKHNWNNAINRTTKLKKTSYGYEMSYWKNVKNASTMPTIKNNGTQRFQQGPSEFERVTKANVYGQCIITTKVKVPTVINYSNQKTNFPDSTQEYQETESEKKESGYGRDCDMDSEARLMKSTVVYNHIESRLFPFFDSFINQIIFPEVLRRVESLGKKDQYRMAEGILLAEGLGIETKNMKRGMSAFNQVFKGKTTPKKAIQVLSEI